MGVNAQSILICGTFKLWGYYNNGSKYEESLIIKKTYSGVVAQGAINSYLEEDSKSLYNSIDIAIQYGACYKTGTFGPFSRETWHLCTISYYKNGIIKVNISDIKEIKCTRIK